MTRHNAAFPGDALDDEYALAAAAAQAGYRPSPQPGAPTNMHPAYSQQQQQQQRAQYIQSMIHAHSPGVQYGQNGVPGTMGYGPNSMGFPTLQPSFLGPPTATLLSSFNPTPTAPHTAASVMPRRAVSSTSVPISNMGTEVSSPSSFGVANDSSFDHDSFLQSPGSDSFRYDDDDDDTVPGRKKRRGRNGKNPNNKSKAGSKQQRRRKSTPPEEDDFDDDDEDSSGSRDPTRHRDDLLARNRVAASRCRERKKAYESELETKARELSERREKLLGTVQNLKEQLLDLKEKCLEHVDCNCVQIREYMKSTIPPVTPATVQLYQELDEYAATRRRVITGSVGFYPTPPVNGISPGQMPGFPPETWNSNIPSHLARRRAEALGQQQQQQAAQQIAASGAQSPWADAMSPHFPFATTTGA